MLKLLDLFGTTFQFTIFKNAKFRTELGAILTILVFIIIIVFVYLFGKDFFFKQNPKLNEEVIFKTFHADPMNITNNNLIIPFRIEDDTQSYTSFENILYPYFKYKSYKKDNSTINNLEVENTIFYKRCDELNLADDLFLENYNLSQWYCLDFSNSSVKIGGYWGADIVDYISFKLFFADNGGNYDYDKLKEFLSKGRYISFLLPTHNFDSSDNIKPLKRIFKNYFYKLNLGMGKYDRIYFQNVTSVDDRGWIVEEINEDVIISYSEIKNDYYLIDLKDDQFNYLYRGLFYLQKDNYKISRSYMKIQDLGAKIGGLISFTMLISRIVTYSYNIHHRNQTLFHILYDYNSKEKIKTKIDTINSERLKSLSYDLSQIKSTKLITSVKNDLYNNTNNNEINIGFFNSIKYKFFPKYVSNSHRTNMNLYKFFINYISDRLDISYYIKLIENLKYLRILLLENKIQNLSFDYIRNPDLNDTKDLKLFEIELEKEPSKEIIQLINYYRNIKETKKISAVDRELYSLLDSKITKYVGKLE